MQRGEALVVGLADVGAVIDELAHDRVLAVETGHVERRVPEGVRLVYLWSEKSGRQICPSQCCYAFLCVSVCVHHIVNVYTISASVFVKL